MDGTSPLNSTRQDGIPAVLPTAAMPPPAPSQPTPEVRAELMVLAECVEVSHKEVLPAWRKAINGDARLSTAQRLSRTHFENHIPELLRIFGEWLRVPASHNLHPLLSPHEQHRAEEYGRHRWHQGYDLLEITREWSALQSCLLETIEGCREKNHLSAAAVFAANRTLTRMVSESISQSVTSFNKTQQTEAAARLRDLTTQLHDLQEAHHVLVELDRTRGQTLRAASHDLKGGLTVVQSAAELLTATLPSVAKNDSQMPMREQLIGTLRKGVNSVEQMLVNLLDLARLEAGHEPVYIEEFDAALLLEDLATTTLPLATQRGLRFTFSGPPSLPVRTDATQVARIAQNLLLNALRYTPEGEVELRWADEPDEEWSFTVCDTGPGLDEGRETSAEASGEGIGLTIVRRLCELLDARPEFNSQPGQGTTIRVVFPRELELPLS